MAYGKKVGVIYQQVAWMERSEIQEDLKHGTLNTERKTGGTEYERNKSV